MKNVNIDFFFKHPGRFPWEYLGWTYPVYGDCYHYLCRYLAEFEPDQKQFLLSKPSLRELESFARDNHGLAGQIIKFYERTLVKKERNFGQPSVAVEVVEFLKEFHAFKKMLEQNLNRDINNGRVKVPEAAFEPNRYYYDY